MNIWQDKNKKKTVNKLVEFVVKFFMILAASVSVITTFGIFLTLIFQSFRFFAQIPLVGNFLLSTHWNPSLTYTLPNGRDIHGYFGMIPLLTGTMLIMFIAMLVAIPFGLLLAIYVSEYMPKDKAHRLRPWLEILAGIPTIVYGFFAAVIVAPFFTHFFLFFHIQASSESALAAGLVMGFMIIPFVSSLSTDILQSVPQSLRDGASALGATKTETIWGIVIPTAFPSLISAFLLGISRAIGETMIVVMAAGLSANLTFNPLAAVTTMTVQIVTLLVGDQSFNSPSTLAAYALGLTLFMITIILNIVALMVIRKYKKIYAA